MATLRSIEKMATNVVKELNGKKTPIDVESIATKLGLKLIEHDLGENVSGVLFIDKGHGVIGYNPNESEVRRRFTIAHEIGHFILHRLNNEFFVDHKQFKPVFRDEKSSTGEIKQEREANAFAAALLMPSEILTNKISKMAFDLGDDNDTLKELASDFNVSTQAMTFRISNLNLF